MSCKVICGKTYYSTLQGLVEELNKNLSLDSINYIIVPSGTALHIKNQIIKALNKKSIFNVKVVDFIGLAKQFNINTSSYISDEQALIIFKSAIKDNESNLKSFYKIVGNDSAERELFGIIDKFAESSINPKSLMTIGVNLGGILGSKVQDIAGLYNVYYKTINGKFVDKHILLDNLVENIKSGKFKACNFYVYGFSSMTAEEIRLLSAIHSSNYNLVVGNISNPQSNNQRIYPRFLTDFYKNSDVKIEYCDKFDIYPNDINLLLDNLFGFNNNVKEKAQNVSIRCADNICQEVKGLCREIRKEIVENNVRYKDIVVFCPDFDKYYSDIKRQFEIFEIPYFMQDQKALSSFAISKVLIDGIKVIDSNYDMSKILAFSKNILLDIPVDDCNKFELYVVKYNLSGDSYLNNFDIGNKDAFYESAKSVYEKLKERLILIDITGDTKTKIARIKVFLSFVNSEIYNNYLNKMFVAEGIKSRQENELALNKLMDIVNSVEQMLGYGDNINLYNVVVDIVQNTKIGISTQFVDNVFITNDSKQIDRAEILYIIGANDGVITKESNNIGIFTYSDLERLASQGVQFKPNLLDKNYNAKFENIQLIAKGNKVVISFNQAVGEASLFVKNIAELLNIKPITFIEDNNKIGMDIGNYAMKIGTKANAKAELSFYYSERMRGITAGEENIFDYLYTKLDGEYKYQNIIKQKNFKYVKPNSLAWSKKENKTFASISAVERYFDCPFKFYCEKTLRLKEVQKSGLDVLTVGTFIHRILEKFFRRYRAFDMTEEELNIIADKLCNESITETDFETIYLGNSKAVLENSLFKKVRYILSKLVQIAKRTEFKTKNTELTFGFEYSDLPPYELKTKDNTYYIRGKIDRIDSYGDYIAVVDYKSKRSVSYGLKEIYYGERVQLLIYLNAYCSKTKCEPFALLYMPLPYTYSNEDSSGVFSYSGLVRNLQGVFEHFDNKYNDKNITSMPISIAKSGDVSDKGLLSQEDLRILREYADKVVANAIEEIESGYIEAKPTNCDNCEFGRICLNKNNPQNKRTKLTASSFEIKGGDTNGKD